MSRLVVDVLGIPALLYIIWQGGLLYAALVAAIVFLGLREFYRLLPKVNRVGRPVVGYLAAIALLAIFSRHAGLLGAPADWATTGMRLLAIVIVLVIALQAIGVLIPSETSWSDYSANLGGVLWIALFGGCFILVREMDYSRFAPQVDVAFRLTLSLYLSVWLCDSLAYLFGKAFGKKKIAPLVSPNKTVVGTVSGLIGAVALMLALGYGGFLPRNIFGLTDLLVFGLITGGFGQLGDFVESRLKRDIGVKDTGKLLPGHGGVLDRFDSLFYVMPLSLIWLELVVLI